MKGLQKHASIFVLVIGLLVVVPLQGLAEDTSNSSGKLRLKVDRIGGSEHVERQTEKMTELEKKAPDLFTEETQTAIEQKKKEMNTEMTELEQSLFVITPEIDTTTEDIKSTLFTSDYTVPKMTVGNGDEAENGSGGSMGKTMFVSLVGMVVLLCGGVFAAMRKMVE